MIRTDEEIKRDLQDELYWDSRVDAANVKTKVSDGKVTLMGTVPSYRARNAAVADAWVIRGVRDVENLLDVDLPSDLVVPRDEEIQTSADRVLAWNPDLLSPNIDVSVRGGVVELEGSVDAYWKKWRAQDLITDLRGVIDVENHLTVVPNENILDKDIARDIEDALERNLYVTAEDITVKVEDGRVTLMGTAPSYYARGSAYDAAAFTPGVIAVDNNILVS